MLVDDVGPPVPTPPRWRRRPAATGSRMGPVRRAALGWGCSRIRSTRRP
ncbi:hypothetical protein HBB16_01175 [Pseudonocardia sp. MCCB 268]|nr:hypothetical protein [Pseudonocardia cytotoxica]